MSSGCSAGTVARNAPIRARAPTSRLVSRFRGTTRPAQCKAARALLGITQSELANAAELGLSTVVDFEKERRRVSPSAIEAMRNTLIKAGVEFIDENGGGPGVRLRKRTRTRQITTRRAPSPTFSNCREEVARHRLASGAEK